MDGAPAKIGNFLRMSRAPFGFITDMTGVRRSHGIIPHERASHIAVVNHAA